MKFEQRTCPSGDPDADDAQVFGIVGLEAERPQLQYADRLIPIAVIREAGLDNTDIVHGLRVASACREGACGHFDSGVHRCGLATAVQKNVSPVVSKLAPCPIRPTCVWWHQEGPEICRRCPVVTREG